MEDPRSFVRCLFQEGFSAMSTTVAPAAESEAALIHRAQSAVSQCNWDVGECAALWTKRFARGRTDADFANLIHLSPDQVYQRRRVWETFGDVRDEYGQLKWSHFYAAITWEDAAECLQWAQDLGATVAEMKAWRRAQRGEDLTTAAEDEDTFGWLPTDASEVRLPRTDAAVVMSGGGSSDSRERDPVPVAAAVAREAGSSGDDYAPFSPDAIKPPTSSSAPERPREAPSIEQLVRKLTTTLERCSAVMNDKFLADFETLPEKDRRRFLKAATTFADKISELE
jgi:hypothetical protein